MGSYSLLFLVFLASCVSSVNFKEQAPAESPLILRFDKFITNSSSTSCGITKDRKLFCNENRIAKDISLFENSIPAKWPVKVVDTGRSHLCAIFEGPSYDEVWCKGAGTSGELGDGQSVTTTTLVKVSGLPVSRFVDLGLASTRSCAVTSDKKVYCWGNSYLPMGVSTSSSTAIETPLTGYVELKGNYSSNCGLKEDKTLWCWGSGTYGVLGQGNTIGSNYTPVKVKNSAGTGFLEDVSHFSVGQTHTCAIVDEEVYCWGLSRRVGVNADGNTTLPRHLPELSGALKVESGDFHSCALLKTNEVYCWGLNRNFQVGGVEDYEVVTPRKIDLGDKQIVDISLGNGNNPSFARSCALTNDGELHCWGSAGVGVFGSIKSHLASSFTQQPDSYVTSISMGDTSQCFIKNNIPYASGFNDYKQFTHDRYIIGAPVPMSADPVTDFSCNRYSNCYVSGNKLFCQGLSYTDRHEITALGSNVAKAVTASHTTCALMLNNDLNCWGTNTNGQVGNGLTTAVALTSPYLTMTNVIDADGGQNVFCAIKSDRTVWCWGSNAYGTIGHNNASETQVNVPTRVHGLPDITLAGKLKIKVERYTACLHADNDVYCWGEHVGTLLSRADQNTYLAEKITAVSGDVEKMAIIGKGVCVSHADTRVTCLSYGSFGLFTYDRVSKVTFPALGGQVQELEGGNLLLCAILTNGNRYCLGNNAYGGMSHAGLAPPLILDPVKWIP